MSTVNAARLPRVSIIIPVLNDAAGLARCLASIKANQYPASRVELLVADNGSSDDSSAVAERAGARVLRLPGLPVSEVRNQLAALASGEVLAFVDADHELSAGWLRSAVDVLAQQRVAAVGAPYRAPYEATWVQRLYDSLRTRSATACETRWLGSGNIAIRKRVFEEVGGFDSTLTTCEDVDLCQRIRQRSYRLIADDRLHSVHYGDPGTLRQLFVSELWRGRDNLLVSLRGPMTWRDLPSVAIPVVVLASLTAIPLGILAAAGFGVSLPLVGAVAGVFGAPAARSLAMAHRLPDRTPLAYAQAFAVAATYDVARALALVCRKAHRRA